MTLTANFMPALSVVGDFAILHSFEALSQTRIYSMTYIISATYSNTWAHPSPTEMSPDNLSFTIQGTIEVKDKDGNLIKGETLILRCNNSMMAITDNGKPVETKDPGKYLLHGDTEGTYKVNFTAFDKTIAPLDYIVDGDPASAGAGITLAFVSYDKASTKYAPPIIYPNSDGEIPVDQDSIKVGVSNELTVFNDDPFAEIALLVNDMHCATQLLSTARDEGFDVQINWLSDTDTVLNKFAYILTSGLNSATTPPVSYALAGKVFIKPQPDDRRTLIAQPFLDRHFAVINAASSAQPLPVYVPIKKGNPDMFATGDSIQVILYINGYDPITRRPKNGKHRLPAKILSQDDVDAAAKADNNIEFFIPVGDIAGFGSNPAHQPGIYYLDFEVTKSGATEPDRMPVSYNAGTINTVSDF
ncbi:hypothetical protein ACI2JN_05210 [Ochrobactrum teleogrylli]|uniref:hypothetical protein n=1 Tax=Ochrobactrum teleogrylli TaxID=2479765 RepID=UPI00384D3CD4